MLHICRADAHLVLLYLCYQTQPSPTKRAGPGAPEIETPAKRARTVGVQDTGTPSSRAETPSKRAPAFGISDAGSPSAGAAAKSAPLAAVSPQEKCQPQSLSVTKSVSTTAALKRLADNADATDAPPSKCSKIDKLREASDILTPYFDAGDNIHQLS